MTKTIIFLLVIVSSTLVSQEDDVVNPVIQSAVSLGAKAVVNEKREVTPGLELTDAMKTYIFGLTWPDKTVYRWKDKTSDLSDILYSLDFNAPTELITEEHYYNISLVGCIVVAGSDHGHLVVPPTEMTKIDPVVWFLDKNEEEGYKNWSILRLRLSKIFQGLEIQK